MAINTYNKPKDICVNLGAKVIQTPCITPRNCEPFVCTNYVKDCNDQWQRIWRKKCNTSRPYNIPYPQDEVLTFQTKFADLYNADPTQPTAGQDDFICVTLYNCQDVEVVVSTIDVMVSGDGYQNISVDTTNFPDEWYLRFEAKDANGEVTDCCFTEQYAAFEVIETDCSTTTCGNRNYIEIEGCAKTDCCGFIYAEPDPTNVFGNLIEHKAKIWLRGSLGDNVSSIETESYAGKTLKATRQMLKTIFVNCEPFHQTQHNQLENIMMGGIVKIDGVKYMIDSFNPDNPYSRKCMYGYTFQVYRECEINFACV